MLIARKQTRRLVCVAAAIAAVLVGVAVALGTGGGSDVSHGANSSVVARTTGAASRSRAPVEGDGDGRASAPMVSAAAFTVPVTAYLTYAGRQLSLMKPEISRLQQALAAGDRGAARDAWLAAYADYLKLGAVYLEGPLAALNQQIDGTPGGLRDGTASPQFTGLHRLEFGLWAGVRLAALQPWARRLWSDVSRLQRLLPTVEISPLDYATRAHEILEDAVRDLLSGTDVPWSGAGVLGTAAALTATEEIVRTLEPLLTRGQATFAYEQVGLSSLGQTLVSLRRAHDGTLPSNAQLTQMQREQLDASVRGALERLALIPVTLDTAPDTPTPPIPNADAVIDR